MSDVLKKFGRYILLDQIAQGGMAEIYRARLAASEGAGRLIVIKRIQAGYGANEEFLRMFKSEIKVTMGFNHPNIVQLYDFGEEQQQPYIAMELVDGKNLRQFMGRFGELKQPFPVELATYIMEQASSGLHYAHSFKDKITGQPLNIVHRDISPQNILISYEGNVKVIDFGIAKTTANAESTRAGVIKGKPSYLSPEQISGEPLDGRSDIFALGIVLWELLVGKKLFAGENDLAVLKQIESCQTHVKPPSNFNPRVPKELDYIVLRALAKQRDKRFQTAEELQRALHKFLYQYAAEFNPADLAYHAKDLFKAEIVEDRKKIQRLNDKVESLLMTDAPAIGGGSNHPEAAAEPAKKREEDTVVDRRMETGSREYRAGSGPKLDLEMSSGVKNPGYGRNSSQMQPQLEQAAQRSHGQPRPRTRSEIHVPRQVTASGNGGGLGKLAMLAATIVIGLGLFGKDYGITIPVVTEMLAGVLPHDETVSLTLTGDLKNVSVKVDGKEVARELPFVVPGVQAEKPINVVVTGPQGAFNRIVSLRKGDKRVLAVALSNAIMRPGSGSRPAILKFNVNPSPEGSTASITYKGQSISIDLKGSGLEVPVGEPLELVVEKPGFKPFRRQFALDLGQSGREAPMDIQLDPLSFGFLTLRTTPSAKVTIMIDGKPWVRNTPIENEKLPTGTYTVELANDLLDARKSLNVTIQEGKVLNLEEQFSSSRLPAGR